MTTTALRAPGAGPVGPLLREWRERRAHLLSQLQYRARAMGDDRLHRLHRLHVELLAYPGGLTETSPASTVVVPMQYRHKRCGAVVVQHHRIRRHRERGDTR